MTDSPYGKSGESWFWRAWTNRDSTDFDGARESHRDFKRKTDARDHAARHGGGTIRKMRFRGLYSTETRTDPIEIEEKG
jgi:hypothetical protein